VNNQLDCNCTDLTLFCKYTVLSKEVDENYQSISSWFESPADVYEIKKILQQFQKIRSRYNEALQ
jgi:hypothetical protein